MESIETIKHKSQEIVLDIMPNIDQNQLLDDTDIFSLGLDSLNAIRLITNLQSKFKVSFTSSEINFDNFRTITNIAEIVAKKQAN
ncbi:MAG: acyl carrier protein [Symploca sp. SIO2C1]|nr:acyl carrier protein [Symploca sp. SIO2C1]